MGGGAAATETAAGGGGAGRGGRGRGTGRGRSLSPPLGVRRLQLAAQPRGEVRGVLGDGQRAQGGAEQLVAFLGAHRAASSWPASAGRRAARARFRRDAIVPAGTPSTLLASS